MSYTTNVVSIGSLNVEEGSGYAATLLQSYLQPENSISRVQRDADSPVVTNIAPGVHIYLLEVWVLSAGVTADDLDARRRALLKALDTTRGPVTVTIINATGTARTRYMQFVARKVDQVSDTRGSGFLASLEAADVVRWRSTSPVVESWLMNATATQNLTVAGDLDVHPVITLTPNALKVAPVWPYRRTFLIEWRSPGRGWHPVDVTGGGLDTEALLAAGRVVDGSNIAVSVDGRIVPHWYGNANNYDAGFNDTATKIWINMEFAPAPAMTLAQQVTESSPWWFVRDDAGLPQAGVLRVDEEYVSYAFRAPGMLGTITRGLYGSTPAAHSMYSDLVPVRVGHILYGPNGATAAGEVADDAPLVMQPVFLPQSDSGNGLWHYSHFARAGGAAGWEHSYYLGGRSAFVQESTATGAYDASWTLPWNAMGFVPGWAAATAFARSFAVPIQKVRVYGRRYMRGSPATLPNSPQLTAHDAAGANSVVLWRSGDGAGPAPNPVFDVTIEPYPTLSDDRPRLTRLSWGWGQANYMQVDIGQMWVWFDDEYAPVVTLLPEATEYDLDLTITNLTTGEALAVRFPEMEPEQSLVIDCGRQTVTYTYDGSNKYSTVRRNAPRPKFMRLAPGLNQLQIAETGMGELGVTVMYEPHWYT